MLFVVNLLYHILKLLLFFFGSHHFSTYTSSHVGEAFRLLRDGKPVLYKGKNNKRKKTVKKPSFLELLGRLELPTSSLPRMRSTT